MSTRTSLTRRPPARTSSARRKTCRSASGTTPPATPAATGGRSRRTSPTSRRRPGEPGPRTEDRGLKKSLPGRCADPLVLGRAFGYCRVHGASHMTDSMSPASCPPPSLLLERVRGEYREMPGLRLTLLQAQRLFGLDSVACALVLEALTKERFLSIGRDGRFAK